MYCESLSFFVLIGAVMLWKGFLLGFILKIENLPVSALPVKNASRMSE